MIDKMIEEMERYKTELFLTISNTCNEMADARCFGGINAIDKCIEIAEKYKAQELKWLSVNYELPNTSGEYLVYKVPNGEEPYIDIEEIECYDNHKEWNYIRQYEIKAWCPIPKCQVEGEKCNDREHD